MIHHYELIWRLVVFHLHHLYLSPIKSIKLLFCVVFVFKLGVKIVGPFALSLVIVLNQFKDTLNMTCDVCSLLSKLTLFIPKKKKFTPVVSITPYM